MTPEEIEEIFDELEEQRHTEQQDNNPWGSDGLRYVSPEVGYVDQDEEYY